MDDCYNEAIEYLKNKYGYRRVGLTCTSSVRLRNLSNNEYKEQLESFTDRNYNLKVNEVTDLEDKGIEVLISQYYYGLSAKKELYNVLLNKGIIKN